MRHTLTFTMVSIALAFPIGEGGSAYAQKIVHDKQKEKQWRSMETGPWDFEPGWYYYFLHKKYSGAETYWKWSGFKSRYRVRFKEHKSNVKTIMPRRIAQEELQKEKILNSATLLIVSGHCGQNRPECDFSCSNWLFAIS